MRFYNLFPRTKAVSSARRLLLLSSLISTVLAIAAGQAAGQAQGERPVARLISSSRQVVPDARRPRPAYITAASSAMPEPAASSLERRAFDLINAQRQANGEAPLAWDAELFRMAQAHSRNMALQGFFNHVGPDGMDMEERARSRGITGWRVLAENIAYNQGFDDPAAFAVERWMLSEKHRANILNRQFNRTAIGMARSADGRIFLTQVFMVR